MRGDRIDRLAHQFQQEIANILLRELKDPRLGFVTITRVELSRDLSHAKVFFSCLGGEGDREKSQEALDHSVGFVRSLIKKRFRLKVIPEFAFRYDASIAGSIELSQMLDRIKQQNDTR